MIKKLISRMVWLFLFGAIVLAGSHLFVSVKDSQAKEDFQKLCAEGELALHSGGHRPLVGEGGTFTRIYFDSHQLPIPSEVEEMRRCEIDGLGKQTRFIDGNE